MRLIPAFATSYLLASSIVAAHLPKNEKFLYQKPIVHDAANSLDSVIAASSLLSFHRALVEVESISGNELDVGKFVVSTLEAHNFSVITQLVPDVTNASAKRWNVYATPDSKKYSSSSQGSLPTKHEAYPKVLLTSHIDTVPPYIPYSLSQPKHSKSSSEILISGRGTVDDKACVAAQIQTALNLLASGSLERSSDLALLFVVSEENTGEGMTHFSDSDLYKSISRDLKGIIFGEPTEGKLASGHKGISMAHIVAHGKAAHSGYPWLGKSANSMLIPALMVLDKLGDLLPEQGGLPRSEEFGNSTVNVGYISGGVAANVIPAFAEAKVAFRLAGGTAESVSKIVRHAISGADPNGELEVSFSQGYGPVPLDTDVEGFESMVVNYGTDVPNLKVREGVKKYLYGPGSILVAHGDNEALTVGDLEQAVVDYEKLVKHVLEL